jgi:ferrous iron transport protein A
MKLIELNKHDVFKIVDFGEVCDEMKQRFASMGVNKNAMGQVIHKGFFGPIEIEFNGSKIAIGRKMAKKIEVKKYECPLFKNE